MFSKLTKNFYNSQKCLHKKEYLSIYSKKDNIPSNITFIGGGKMAESIINGIQSKIEKKITINVIEINKKRSKYLQKTYKINNISNVKNSDFIILCVKPQNIETIKEYFDDYNVKDDTLLISLIAGKNKKQLKDLLPRFKNIIRIMPNIPVSLNKGTIIWYPCNNIKGKHKSLVKNFLQILGEEIEVNEEKYLEMGTAISGTGPAYVFLLAESLIDSAVHLGFSRVVAEKIVLSTINGSANISHKRLNDKDNDKDNISNMRYDVVSPGGATASAMYELEKGSFRTIVNDSVWSAYRRTVELGDEDSRVGPGRYKY